MMKYRQLGRTGLQVSEIGFGAWAIGGGSILSGSPIGYGPTDDEESIGAIHRALDLGVNFIDTAQSYGAGRSETLIGKALKGRDEECFISTKVGNVRTWDTFIRQDFSPQWIAEAAEASFERLQREVIDVYLLHGPPPEVLRADESFEALRRLKEQGKVRSYGVSINATEEGIELIEAKKVDVLEVVYNLLEQEPARELLPLAKEKNIGIIVMSPLHSGALTGKFTLDTTFATTDFRSRHFAGEQLRKVVERVGKLGFLVGGEVKSLAQAALKFILCQEAVSVVIPGAKTAKQVEQNVAASEGDYLPQEDLKRIAGLWESDFSLAG